MKSIAERFQLSVRTDKLSWRHHYEVASIKLIGEIKKGCVNATDLELPDERGERTDLVTQGYEVTTKQ